MLRTFVFMSLIVGTLSLYGQKKVIEGQVLDSSDKPLVGAEIKISEGGGTQALVSDSKGFFKFKYASEGEDLWVLAAYQGATFYEAKIKLVRDTFLLLRYVAQSEKDNSVLDTAVVRGYKKSTLEAQADRFVFTPNEELKAGKSVTDLLNAAPMLQFDEANAQGKKDLQILGKESTDIYINGKRTFIEKSILLQMLQGQNASDIEKIEIIRSPNVSYDAAGGIVNIIMKKNNLKGLVGNARLDGFKNSFYNYTGNISLNYNFYNLSTYFTGYGGNSRNALFINSKNNFISLDNYLQDSKTRTPSRNYYHGGFSTGFSYDVSARQNIQVDQSVNYGYYRDISENENSFYRSSDRVDSSFFVRNNSLNVSLSSQTTINYTFHTDKKGSMFESFFNYLFYRDDTEAGTDIEKDKSFDVNYLQRVPRRIHSLYLGAQYLQVLNDKHSLQGGFKGYYTYTDNPVLFQIKNTAGASYEPYPELSNHLVYKEPLYTVFFQHKGNWHSKFQSVLGLKVDNTYQIGTVARGSESLQRNWLLFLPTLHLNYNISNDHNVNFAFNSSVRKPSISTLNPYREIVSNNYYSEGNPFIRVVTIYNQELSYTFFQKYSFVANYFYLQNQIQSVPVLQAGRVNYGHTELNIPYTSILWLYFSMNETFFKGRWQMTGYLGVPYYYANGGNPFFEASIAKGWGVWVRTNHTIVLNKSLDNPNKWLLGIGYGQVFREVYPYGITRSNAYVQFSLTKKYKDWTFNMFVRDPFRSARSIATIEAPHLAYFERNDYYDKQALSLSVSYQFGNKKLKVQELKDGGNENKGRAK